MILTIGNVKGGVGKTTLAVHFAIGRAAKGRDVLLIDGDEQGTALTFTELRAEHTGLNDYTAVACQRRMNFPQKCRSKFPHFCGFGDQPVMDRDWSFGGRPRRRLGVAVSALRGVIRLSGTRAACSRRR